MTTGKTIALTRWTFVGKVMSAFQYAFQVVIAFLPRSKHLLISWLHSPAVLQIVLIIIHHFSVVDSLVSVSHLMPLQNISSGEHISGSLVSLLQSEECWPIASVVAVQLLGRVRLFATPWTEAHQAPLPMGFSRQEYWGGLPFSPPGDLASPQLALSKYWSYK